MHSEPMAVIINTCNRPFMLKDLVHSVADQLGPRDWIIIVNDGDSDKKLPDMEKGNIYEVRHCKDYYAIASGRNRGAEKAIDLGYEWGLLLDDDVKISDHLIEKHRSAWDDKNTAYAGKITKGSNKDIRKKWWNGEGDFVVKWGGTNMSCHLPSLLDAGGYNEEFDGHWGSEDNELFYRLREDYGWNIEYLENAIIEHLQGPVNGDYQRKDPTNKSKLEEMSTYNG